MNEGPSLKPDLLETILDLSQRQVEFGDTKASLLVAGDAILLAITGALIRVMSGPECRGDHFAISCVEPSVSLALATTTALLLTVSLICALRAARPAKIHDDPPPQLFLISYIARLKRDEFAKKYRKASPEEVVQETLTAIHGRSAYAASKFRWLKRAIDMTLLSVAVMLIAVIVEGVGSHVAIG